MKKKALNRALGTCVVSIALCGVGTGNVLAQETSVGIFDSPFDQCFVDGYNIEEVTKGGAFATAECFTSLLGQEDGNYLGASRVTIMQYSASWYEAAAKKGHELAQAMYDTNLLALNSLEKQIQDNLIGIPNQLLASEQRFDSLDADKNGLLSVAEASSELRSVFNKSDMDSDGMLSYGEYAIYSGEATAAGN